MNRQYARRRHRKLWTGLAVVAILAAGGRIASAKRPADFTGPKQPAAQQAGATPLEESPLDRAVRELPKAEKDREQHSPAHSHAPASPHKEHAPSHAAKNGGFVAAFLACWCLSPSMILSGLLIAALLSLIGVLVVARDQIFIGAAVAQASALGIAVGLWSGGLLGIGWLGGDVFLASVAVVFAVSAALVTAKGGTAGVESAEVITGWVFLGSAALSVLLLAHGPYSMRQIQRVLTSTLIGADAIDVWTFAIFLAITAAGLAFFHRKILLSAVDPETAAAIGLRVGWWTTLVCLWLGLAVGLSMRVSGLLFTFGYLVMPAVIAKNICREIRPLFLVAPVVAVATAAVGFTLAHYYDVPPAQMSVAALCLFVVLGWCFRLARGVFSGAGQPGGAPGGITPTQ